jgi:hypothetical protein
LVGAGAREVGATAGDDGEDDDAAIEREKQAVRGVRGFALHLQDNEMGQDHKMLTGDGRMDNDPCAWR